MRVVNLYLPLQVEEIVPLYHYICKDELKVTFQFHISALSLRNEHNNSSIMRRAHVLITNQHYSNNEQLGNVDTDKGRILYTSTQSTHALLISPPVPYHSKPYYDSDTDGTKPTSTQPRD